AGPRKGEMVLPEAEVLPAKLVEALDEEQRKTALQGKQFPEIEQHNTKPTVGEPVGLPASKMNAKQKELLMAVIKGYLGRVREDVVAPQLAEVQKAGLD